MLLRVSTVVILALFIQQIEGIERVIVVSESDVDLVSDDEDTLAASALGSGSGSYVFDNSCCVYGNCSCPSLYNALTSLTSNVLINITATDVMLSSIIPLLDLANITITGHNNPTVNCNNSGGLHFISCHNCTIQGITWDECGARNITDTGNVSPVIRFCDSSNITLRSCTFQHSIRQAVVLSQMIGDVNIDHCNFLDNKQYEGHGTAIHYSSNNMSTGPPIKFMITGCNFLYNGKAKSVVYFNQSSAKFCNLQNSKFYHNSAVPIYLSNQNLYMNGNIKFQGNVAENGGGMFISDHSNVTFHKSATVDFRNNTANNNEGVIFLTSHSSVVFGGVMYIDDYSNMTFEESCKINFKDNNGGVMYIDDSSAVDFEGNCKIMFRRNRGGVMYIDDNSTIIFQGNSIVTFNDNVADNNGGVMYIGDYSTITFQGNSTVTFNDNEAYNGGVMYIDSNSTMITFQGNSTVTFNDNRAINDGGVMFIGGFFRSTIIFQGNSTVTFNDNEAFNDGGVMVIGGFSTITFQGNSTVTFNDNGATNGGVMFIGDYSTITFQGNSTVTFNDNEAVNDGGVMFIDDSSTITFQGNSTVTFNDNGATNGGVMFIGYYSTITFQGNSTVTFNDNGATNGGVMFIGDYSSITFQGNSTLVTFNDNRATNGGVMFIGDYSTITFQGNSTVTFNDNGATNGGVMFIGDYSTFITFQGNSTVTFNDNEAGNNGGVMVIDDYSTITFQGNSTVTFKSNVAYNSNGGVMFIGDHFTITFQGNSTVTFNDNRAINDGGVMFISRSSTITFQGNSTVTFNDNEAFNDGGVMVIGGFSGITFQGNSTVTFTGNHVDSNGGVMFIDLTMITFQANSTVTFIGNSADSNGGVMFIDEVAFIGDYSTITFQGNSTVTFNDNEADSNGGVMYIDDNSTITFQGNSTVTFNDNRVINDGGVMYIDDNSTITFQGNSTVTFTGNHVDSNGGVMYIGDQLICDITFKENSTTMFNNNEALRDGGAVYLSDHSSFVQLNYSDVTFYSNRASDYGGAIYVLFKVNYTNFNIFDIYFKDNTAGTIQNSVYINVQKSCGSSCLFHDINIANKDEVQLATSPNRLTLYNTAKCINGNDTDCYTYYMNNIMLGQEITLDACLLDYYDQPTEAAQFSITGMNHSDYNISGSEYITISCNRTTQGLGISGNLHLNNSYNYTLNVSLYTTRASESKDISVTLIIELSQCHPGFWYSNESQKCECYDADNIISCSGSNSTIRRGYWFGSVTEKPTVTLCPNDYCNFTCCETTNGVYHLSPVRANQCRPHRFGTACGNCEKGYTLSFDSPECVEVNKCTIGTVLVTTLSLLYWIAVVVAVFAMTYFKVAIGSLYVIVYYYSVVDILLSRVLFISNGLYTTVSVMSSLAKLTPQFLGQLCLVRDMSGIDQQFIHYIHPVVILSILILISVLARKSRRVSSFVSRGIIHFICFLLLLSYASVASTSLLLMRPLTFIDIDKVYTYLSPDIEYFHDRHIAYVIVAIIFTIVFVIGFPLLLLLEPFLNSKINFIKIKPLLDQFQGCYKDKYRCFAGFYMICRLVIILLVIVKISDDFTTQYLLISSCALMQLIHVLVRPYISTIHNVFDGIILQLIVIISVLPIVEFVDNYDETFVLMIIYLLVILPLISFVAIKVWINKNIIQNTIKYLINICSSNEVPTTNLQEPAEMREFDIVVDDNTRKNVTIVDM